VIGAEKHDINRTTYPSFSGWIDEVRLSNSIRYTGDFVRPAQRFTADPNTVGLWHLDEGFGNVINDSSGFSGGPSQGVRKYGGETNGPEWTDDTLWYVPPPTPTPTSTSTATATATPSTTPTPNGSETATPTATASATAATSTPTATNTATPTSTATATPTLTPNPTATPTATASATPIATDTPTATAAAPTATSTLTPTPDGPRGNGDLNDDGQVNVLDVQLCVNVFLGVELDPETVDWADVNRDTRVDVLDVQAIVNVALSG
jgi:hypothetical protein